MYNPATMLLYRRHLRTCRHRKKGQHFAGCKCPIWIDGILNGKRYRRALETCNWEKAERKKAGLESAGEDRTSKAVTDALAAWDDYLVSQKLRESTLRKYRRLQRQFSDWCAREGYLMLQQITVEALDSFRASRKDIQASTSARELEILRAVFSFCADRGWAKDNPARRIRIPKIRTKEKKPYTREEIVAILAACELIGQEAYERDRAKAMVMIMRHTGLRVGDAFMLRKDQVREGKIFLHAKKNSQPVFLPVPVELETMLATLPLPAGTEVDCGYYFWNGKGDPKNVLTRVQKALHSVYVKSRVRGAHSHRFRHTVATEALASGASLATVADILGISIHVAEKYYIKWTPKRQENVWEIMTALQKPQAEVEKYGTRMVHRHSGRVN